MKHARTQANEVMPAAKRIKLTPWQAYMKDFGQTDGTFMHKYTAHMIFIFTNQRVKI